MVPIFGKRLSVYRVHDNTKMSNFGQKNVLTHHWKIFNGTLKPSNGAFKTAHHISGLLMNATPTDDTLQPPNTTAHKKNPKQKTLNFERWIYGFMFSVQTETNHVCGWKTGEK